jgi:hypothetical protein
VKNRREEPTLRTFWLSFHAPYRCRDAGVCCTSGWPIPLELHRESAIRAAIETGRLSTPVPWLSARDVAPDHMAGALSVEGGACVFYQRPSNDGRATGACAIHRGLGHAALPTACQHFPRVCLIDARGVSVTLSHYCPTAAALLHDREPIAIVDGPPALADDAAPEGLDARHELPPLLNASILMDHGAYARWERHMIAVLSLADQADAAWSIDAVVARLEAEAAALDHWRPGDRTLSDAIARLEDGAVAAPPPVTREVLSHDARLFETARRALESSYSWPAAPDDYEAAWHRYAIVAQPGYVSVLVRYLAAHAFASWLAYQGRGVRSVVRGVRLALAVARIESLRVCAASHEALSPNVVTSGITRADLLLRHLCNTDLLAAHLETYQR